MTITLIRPKKPRIEEWIITVLNTTDFKTHLSFSASVKHPRSEKYSGRFNIEYYSGSGALNTDSDGYGWNSYIAKDLKDPNEIIKNALKKPIIVAVMFHVGTNPMNQTKDLNDYFGCRVFAQTTER
jgi:hypothetical protein